MKPIISEIIEGVGLGKLKFGMEMNTVQLLLGKPEEKDNYSYTEEEEEEDLTESWYYDELELSLVFDQQDAWVLSTIAITSKYYRFDEFSPIGLSKEQLTAKLKEKKVNDLELEDWSTEENPSHELLCSELLGINFWFDGDRLTEVQWGPLVLDDETIKWPE